MRMLSLFLSLVCGLAYGWWASHPVWTVSGYQQFNHVGHSDERCEFVTLGKSNDQWHFETRSLRTGQLLKYIPVEMPTHFRYVLNYENINLNNDGHDVASFQCEGEHYGRDSKTLVFNLSTGRMIIPKGAGEFKNTHSTCGSRYVLTQDHLIFLIDDKVPKVREVPMESPVRTVHFMHGGELILCMVEGGLFVVRWNDGEILHFLQLPSRINYINVLKDSSIVLSGYDHVLKQHHVRKWKWDGLEVVPVTTQLVFAMPGNINGARTIGSSLAIDDQYGRWCISSYGAQTWPSLLRPILQWLHDQRFDVEKYYPKQIHLFWKILNAKGDIVGEDETTEWRQFNVLTSRRLCYQTNLTGSMCLRSTAYIWPNALAVSIVVWLLCYVYRHRRWQVTPKP